jgi:hypothetical protein
MNRNRDDLAAAWKSATFSERIEILGSYCLTALGAVAIGGGGVYLEKKVGTIEGFATSLLGGAAIFGGYQNVKKVISNVFTRINYPIGN